MKGSKDRLHRVIVIGATPAGISAANKLGELDIPVTLVDTDYDLDKKLSREEWRLKSGVPLNFAHRSGLIRLFRNPGVRCILPMEITSLKHTPQGFRMRFNRQQTFIDPDKCTLCGRCYDICPAFVPEEGKAVKLNSRQSLPGRAVIEKGRKPLCQENCPLGVNAQGYITLTKAGRYAEALSLVRENNILPGICGRICTHPCEDECRRGELDDAIAIRDIKRFLADHELSDKSLRMEEVEAEKQVKQVKNEKIAVIGSGPSGLAAAADLARLGYQVTIFEKEAKAGGLLRYGIGPHRLPREILDKELEYIENIGIRIETSTPVDLKKGSESLDKVLKEYDAVIFAVGTWSDRCLGIPGEDLQGVEGGLSFLNRLYREDITELKSKVAVIGDGNSAFDLGRTLSRIGADVTILSWFPEDLVPADSEEVLAAGKEGIKIKCSLQVVEFKGKNGKVESIVCRQTAPGEPDENGVPWPVIVPAGETLELEFDRVFVATGQQGSFTGIDSKIKMTDHGYIKVDDNSRTNIKKVYATGDTVSGPSSVVSAMSSGRTAAQKVHQDISGMAMNETAGVTTIRPQENEYRKIPDNVPSQMRPAMPEIRADIRRNNFSEVAVGLSESQVISEAGRCLQCGLCSECLECVVVCGATKAVNHAESCEELIEHAGVVIIADPSIAPTVKGEDVIRAYGPRSAKTDVYAMYVRGFASAAQAMMLLGKTSQRPKGHGVSFSPPDPGLSPEIRLGIFVCKCNESLGWLDEMNRYVEELTSNEDVVHSEILNSACVPEDTAGIIRTIREKGITRVVLASCVCCPLNFVCNSCTDQRSRLKENLFKGTGISRSMIETCNIRGEALRLVEKDASLALSRFEGILERSVNRGRRLKPLPAPARDYNFNTAVIGESEAAINSALTLAESGVEVFLFGISQAPPVDVKNHLNVHFFENSTVKAITGTVGNFQVFIESNGFKQSINVGALIIGEKTRKDIHYIHQDGLPGRSVRSVMQKAGVTGIPFFYPGATAISGLYLADPPGINVSNRQKGAAAAAHAIAIMPRGPRQSRGFTVVIDENRCRGCGRCDMVCPYQAVSLQKNQVEGWYATVDEALCKGCGNCISVCPSSAADSPYRNHSSLENMLEEILE